METECLQTPETLGVQALDTIKNSHPPQWLAPPPELSNNAKIASKYIFSQIIPKAPKCPLSSLLTDDFDAEQIWQQIDLQAQPLLSSLKRRVKSLDKTSETLTLLVNDHEPKTTLGDRGREADDVDEDSEDDDVDAEVEEMESSEFEESDEQEPEKQQEQQKVNQNEDESEENGEAKGLEDQFFKISDLEKFLNEAEEQGLEPPKELTEDDADESLEEEDEEDDDEDRDEDEDGDEEAGDDFGNGGQHGKSAKYSTYEDFFGGRRKKPESKKQFTSDREPQEMDSGDDDIEMNSGDNDIELNSGDDEIRDSDQDGEQPTGKSSTHERQKEKIRKKIEQLEKENLDTKSWTMQGEVTAAKRPKNSALEVELDFDHNTRPAPVITEEVTSSLEDIIKRRIAEEQFDDVQPKLSLPSTAPKKQMELDENKSGKGLAEIYEAEYMQRTGLASAPLASSDLLKNEAALLFKRLCVKLDALSHFQFTPKPVIEDMSIQANVPALAMEEIAPVAVSDASMLAPEELFKGEGPVKDEGELTQEDRKRLRASKKRKRKAQKASKEIKTKVHISKNHDEKQGNWKAKAKDQKLARTHYGKSSKVFSDLDRAKDKAPSKLSQHKTDVPHPSFLKL